MRKIILLTLTALMMVGCDIRDKKSIEGNWPKEKSWSEIVEENRRIRDSIEQKWHGYELIVIDSCEYLRKELISYRKAAFETVHKGNCKFCAERRQKELKKLVEQIKK